MAPIGARRGQPYRTDGRCPDPDAIYYSSFQYGPRFAVMLFGDRTDGGIVTPVATRSVSAADCHAEIVTVARQLSIEYEDV